MQSTTDKINPISIFQYPNWRTEYQVPSARCDTGADIENVVMKDRDDRYTSLRFIIEVQNRIHLAQVMRRVRGIKSVNQISRQ